MSKRSKQDSRTGRLFSEPQRDFFDKSAEEAAQGDSATAIECLGMTFESEEARRKFFLEQLRQKLAEPEFREITGFPIATDEDILRLSDPPYYTACPNPFLENAIAEFRRRFPSGDGESVKPFATDISEGKGEHFYNVHTYHTKVPYRAIARFVDHYTRPGDVVLDAFCGTGMVGLAVQACGSSDFLQELGQSDSGTNAGPRLGILVDLSPAAAHIAANYNAHLAVEDFELEASAILEEFRSELGWMFTTRDSETGQECPVDYFVWSDVFGCPECGWEILFWEAGVDKKTGYKNASKLIECPSCSASNSRDAYVRVTETYFDELLGATAKKQKEELVLIAYRHKGERREKDPDEYDREVLQRVEAERILDPVPLTKMMFRDGVWGDMYRAGYHIGISHFHHFYYRRSLRAVAWLWNRVESAPGSLRMRLRWWLQSVGVGHTRLNRYFTSSYSQVNRYLKGFLYVAQVRSEVAPWYSLQGKIKRMAKSPPGHSEIFVATGSATSLDVPDSSVDYVFTDPPFGGNIIYSELNFMWEAWLGVYSRQDEEAIVSKVQGKGLKDYEALMERAFSEYFRVLKPNKWISILFHNSHNAVWAAIQSALQRVGFVVADVRVFDKKQLTMKQQTAAGTVQKDLLITAYRPTEAMRGDTEGDSPIAVDVWDFVTGHLAKLPVVVVNDEEIEQLAERMRFLLFDRMVAFYVERGMPVPTAADDFYRGLAERYPMRDDMYFLSEQVAEYDRERNRIGALGQLTLFVVDEATAIQWVRQQLQKKPQTFQEVQPLFMREVQGWAKHEKPSELHDVLRENFLCYEGEGPVPTQIHSYLSSNFRDYRNREKADPLLVEKGLGRWYVADPGKQADLDQLRLRRLRGEFEEYRSAKQKKLRQFRKEAIRAGFSAAWNAKDFEAIVDVAKKVPDSVLQEDPDLLMYYDNATTLLGTD